MSTANNEVFMIGAVVVGLYLISKRTTTYTTTRNGAVGTMPGSAGTGWQQVGANALTGFLIAATSGISNSANRYTPSLSNGYQSQTDYMQSQTLQDDASSGYDVGMWL